MMASEIAEQIIDRRFAAEGGHDPSFFIGQGACGLDGRTVTCYWQVTMIMLQTGHT
jgi:hypothetical protein